MSRRNLVWSVVTIAAATVLIAANSAKADVVAGSLLYLDAADADGNGVKAVGSGTTWVNKATTGATYNGTLGICQSNATLPAWAGTGTTSDPYTLQFRFPDGAGSRTTGYVAVDNSYTSGNIFDTPTYTYEVWTKINGAGNGYDANIGSGLGTLIGHNTSAAGQGRGNLAYNTTSATATYTNGLWTQGGSNDVTALPNSAGVAAVSGYHQIVLARGGDGSTDSAWYLDGVLQGTLQTSTSASVDSYLTIGCRSWGMSNNFIDCPNADISIARVYGTALTAAEVLQNYNADCATFGLSSVPEPSTCYLIGMGIVGLLAYAWRRRK